MPPPVIERIVRGDSNKHVARFFNIAEPTVKAHVKAIFRKIGRAIEPRRQPGP
jgi:two-component system, NarL family, nitrate/nitrite response regulator NarL